MFARFTRPTSPGHRSNRISPAGHATPTDPSSSLPRAVPAVGFPRRADLHCHSVASTEAGEALLGAIGCPESYSDPMEIYRQALRRGMDFVCITDHDTLNGIEALARLPDAEQNRLIVGEELTCFFPEDQCKMHILVWGHTREQHDALQAMASDIYQVAAYFERHRLAHSVAHPVYRQNDRLERWHLERLMLLFKCFETLNGAHSVLHRESFEPMLNELNEDRLAEYARRHDLHPLWPQPHVKGRTGGSDDHGLFNIGRTWTEFPHDVETVDDALEALRAGRTRAGGEAGSSLKLAHNFYSVGIKYFGRQMLPRSRSGRKPPMSTRLLQTLIGEGPAPRRRDLIAFALKRKMSHVGQRLTRPFRRRPANQPMGTTLLADLFVKSFEGRIGTDAAAALHSAMKKGYAPLGEHEAVFGLLSEVNRDISRGIVDAVGASLGQGKLFDLFDTISAVAAHQFLLSPYYFALFHQNRERHLLRRITGHGRRLDSKTLRVGVFTDTYDEINGVARFVKDMGSAAIRAGRNMVVHTCCEKPGSSEPFRKNFRPLVSVPLPQYPELTLCVPPVAEILEWADRQQFDAIHVDTPGPMGLIGLLVAKMLRVPVLGTYHTDLPAYVMNLTQDHRLFCTTQSYMKWFYGTQHTVFSRSREYRSQLAEMGIDDDRIEMSPPAIDTERFNPRHDDTRFWAERGITHKHRLLYVGRVSVEKNLPMLVEAFKQLCGVRNDVALVIAGDGPYRAKMTEQLAGLPVSFLGYQNDQQLAALYAGADLFVFPSKTDTMGQVVVEALASGLPVLVSDEGGPKEMMDDGLTGLVLPDSPSQWAQAIDRLLTDTGERERMSRTAPQRVARFSVATTFESFWDHHLAAARGRDEEETRPVHADGPADPELQPTA